MLSDSQNAFTKDNLDEYLKALGKEYRRINGKAIPVEIVLIGGAAIVTNYNFRDMTTDIDALMYNISAFKEAINIVGDKYNLPNDWLNSDFMKTSSYSNNIARYSKKYKTFSNVLNVYTLSGEYLIAMKLCSGRKYKKDLSDIIGILYEHKQDGTPISMDDIDKAVKNLYGSWDSISSDTKEFIKQTFDNNDLKKAYEDIFEEEQYSKSVLTQFEKNYPEVMNMKNAEDILKALKQKRDDEDNSK